MAATSNNPRLILGLKVRQLRQAQGHTLSQLASRANLSPSYLSEIEKGHKYPKPERLVELAGALGVSYDDLVSLELGESLKPLREVLGSPLLQGFPFELFGVEAEDLLGLAGEDPVRFAALLHTFLEVGRSYDMRVEQFLLAAMRSYQELQGNHFPEVEAAAAEFREEHDLTGEAPIPPEALADLLRRLFDYTIDEEALIADPELAGFRSVYAAGPRATRYLNNHLLPSQQAFVLGRELGYRVLGLTERAASSSWIRVESFEQVLNHFRASYFSGALLLDADLIGRDLEEYFARETWSPQPLLAMMRRLDATPETYFTRLSQLLPERFGLRRLFFMRFTRPVDAEHYRLTKVLNMSGVAVPHGVGLAEHYCRRWPAMAMLRTGIDPAAEPLIEAQRSHFLNADADFLVITSARPLSLSSGFNSTVTLGFLIDGELKRTVRFWEDREIPRVDVNLTCERCALTPEECEVRAAEPTVLRHEELEARRQAAVVRLIEGGAE